MKRTKQITRWIIALAGLMIATGAVQAKDYDFKYNGLYYKITKKINFNTFEVKVVPEKAASPYYSAGNEPTGAVTIPKDFTLKTGSFIRTYDVTEIGDHAFYGCKGITSVTIPGSVKTIEAFAFNGCKGITSISIPANVKTIGQAAFAHCTALKSVTLSNGIQEIITAAFAYCTALQSIHIPASVKTIGQWAFTDCTALQSIDIPASVTTIGKRAFEKCTALKTVTVHWNTPLNVPDDVFYEVNTKNVTLKVPKGKEAAYKAHDVWGKFKFEGGSTPPPPPPAVPVTSVTLDQTALNLNNVATYKLNATVLPNNATNPALTWTSSDNAIATVDATGLMTIRAKGSVVITASTTDGSAISASCTAQIHSVVANETVDGLRVFASGGALHLTLPSPETAHIYHVDGAMVKTLVLPAGDHVQPLPSGVYVVRVGERVTKILIK